MKPANSTVRHADPCPLKPLPALSRLFLHSHASPGPGFGYEVSGIRIRVSGIRIRVSGFGFWVPHAAPCPNPHLPVVPPPTHTVLTSARWTTDLSSTVNLPDAIDVKVVSCANLVTLPTDIQGNEILVVHRVVPTNLSTPLLSSDDVSQETSARYRAVEPSSGSNVIPRWARPGLAGLRPHDPPCTC